jgi:hypothetical protein
VVLTFTINDVLVYPNQTLPSGSTPFSATFSWDMLSRLSRLRGVIDQRVYIGGLR